MIFKPYEVHRSPVCAGERGGDLRKGWDQASLVLALVRSSILFPVNVAPSINPLRALSGKKKTLQRLVNSREPQLKRRMGVIGHISQLVQTVAKGGGLAM